MRCTVVASLAGFFLQGGGAACNHRRGYTGYNYCQIYSNLTDSVILNTISSLTTKKRQTGTMTVLATFSYGLIAFGPVGALFCTTVARHPHEVIIMMAG